MSVKIQNNILKTLKSNYQLPFDRDLPCEVFRCEKSTTSDVPQRATRVLGCWRDSLSHRGWHPRRSALDVISQAENTISDGTFKSPLTTVFVTGGDRRHGSLRYWTADGCIMVPPPIPGRLTAGKIESESLLDCRCDFHGSSEYCYFCVSSVHSENLDSGKCK